MTTGDSIAQAGGFNLHTEVLDALPLVDHFCHRLALNEWLHTAVGGGDARTRLSPARALGVAIRNICLHPSRCTPWESGRPATTRPPSG